MRLARLAMILCLLAPMAAAEGESALLQRVADAFVLAEDAADRGDALALLAAARVMGAAADARAADAWPDDTDPSAALAVAAGALMEEARFLAAGNADILALANRPTPAGRPLPELGLTLQPGETARIPLEPDGVGVPGLLLRGAGAGRVVISTGSTELCRGALPRAFCKPPLIVSPGPWAVVVTSFAEEPLTLSILTSGLIQP